MADRFALTGKVALVTGASGGLGRHFAKVLAEAGAELVLAARRQDALADTAAAIHAAGGKARTVPLDVTDAASVDATFAAAGPIDILVNNSGVTTTTPAVELAEAEWDRIVDTNLKGAWLASRAFARQAAAARRPGTIVNIASILGLRVAGQVSAYAVSKAGLIQLTQAMALELARHRIRVNALAPGYIETAINRDFFQSERGQALIARIPQRRLGRMTDLDGPLLLLASDASAFMTGSVVAVDGGHLVSSL